MCLDTYKIEVIRACALVHVYVRVCGGFLRMHACVSVRTRRMRVGAYPGMRTGVRVPVHTLTALFRCLCRQKRIHRLQPLKALAEHLLIFCPRSREIR